MVFPYFTFSNQEIDNLVTYMKNPNSILNAHPVFNQMRQGYNERDSWPSFLLIFLSFPPPGEQAGGRSSTERLPGWGGSSALDSRQGWDRPASMGLSKPALAQAGSKGPTTGSRVKVSWCCSKVIRPQTQRTCKHPPIYATFFDSHSCPCLYLPYELPSYIKSDSVLSCYFSLFSVIYPPR